MPILGLTHLSMNKEALGRRIVEKARVVIKMTQPDPEGQPDRRRLWVDKTAIHKPPPLGVTMTDKGNDYDFDPPKEPDASPRKPGPPPARLEECKKWLAERLTPNPTPVKDVRTDSDNASFSADTLYKSRDAIEGGGVRRWPPEVVEAARCRRCRSSEQRQLRQLRQAVLSVVGVRPDV